MKKPNKPSPICPKLRAFGMILTLSLYLALSAFSVYELVHLSEIISTACMRWKTVFVFVIAVLLPIYLVYVESSVTITRLKLALELTPFAILLILYGVSVSDILARSCMADISSILISDIISSLILLLFEKLKHAEC